MGIISSKDSYPYRICMLVEETKDKQINLRGNRWFLLVKYPNESFVPHANVFILSRSRNPRGDLILKTEIGIY